MKGEKERAKRKRDTFSCFLAKIKCGHRGKGREYVAMRLRVNVCSTGTWFLCELTNELQHSLPSVLFVAK